MLRRLLLELALGRLLKGLDVPIHEVADYFVVGALIVGLELEVSVREDAERHLCEVALYTRAHVRTLQHRPQTMECLQAWCSVR
jgi:hypothetical protein